MHAVGKGKRDIRRAGRTQVFIDGTLVLTSPTTAGNDLLSAMVQGYNFGDSASYSVYWDNVTASVIPEPGTSALITALGTLGVALLRRRRSAH